MYSAKQTVPSESRVRFHGLSSRSHFPSEAEHPTASPSPLATHPLLQLQRQYGNQYVQQTVQRRSGPPPIIQAKLTLGQVGDRYEQEADRVAKEVVNRISSAPSDTTQRMTPEDEEMVSQRKAIVQRMSPEDEEMALTKPLLQRQVSEESEAVSPEVESAIQRKRGTGQALDSNVQGQMESAFGVNFEGVRVHTDTESDTLNRSLNARAFTTGQDIFFRQGEYSPESAGGKELLAHELTHVVQQSEYLERKSVGAGEANTCAHNPENHSVYKVQRLCSNCQEDLQLKPSIAMHQIVQRVPGDGMVPPGDCSWADYLILRGSVETAKAVVNTLGGCSGSDSCLLLATKIAAISAEIAARVALDTTCFRGGDSGHRRQVQNKINMMNRCYRFFTTSNCSPELVAAMAVVVERAREVIAVGAAAVAIAAIVALIIAIIALAEVIAALIAAAAAAAAEGAAIGAAAAAVIALLVALQAELSPDGASSI